MNQDQNTSGMQPANQQTAHSFTQEASLSVSGSGAVAPSSPISIAEHSETSSRSTLLQFARPKTIALMVVVWLVVIAGVSAVVATKPKANLSQANAPSPAAMVTPLNPEEEQKSDVNLLNDRLVEYYARFGTYPSTSQINSEQFRQGDPSFIKIGRKTFTDPTGTNTDLANKPTKGQYHYIPEPLNCNSSSILCTGYTVGATLISGGQYNLHSAE